MTKTTDVKRRIKENIRDIVDDIKIKYEDSDSYFITHDIQLEWFLQENPNARITVRTPEPSPDRTPNSYVATVYIFKDGEREKPDIIVSDRARPSDGDVDPFSDCQRKAISRGLKMLGYWPLKSLEEMKEEAKASLLSSPASMPAYNPGMEVVKDISEQTNDLFENVDMETGEILDDSSKKSDAKSEVKVNEESKKESTVNKKTPTTQVADKTKKSPAKSKVDTQPFESLEETKDEEVKEAKEEMSLEEALNTPIEYRNYRGKLMKDISDPASEKNMLLLDWFAKSNMAAEKHPKEAEAARVILKANSIK